MPPKGTSWCHAVVTNYETEIHIENQEGDLAMMACYANHNEHAGKQQKHASQHARLFAVKRKKKKTIKKQKYYQIP